MHLHTISAAGPKPSFRTTKLGVQNFVLVGPSSNMTTMFKHKEANIYKCTRILVSVGERESNAILWLYDYSHTVPCKRIKYKRMRQLMAPDKNNCLKVLALCWELNSGNSG